MSHSSEAATMVRCAAKWARAIELSVGGQELFVGCFRVHERIGEGGGGTVYSVDNIVASEYSLALKIPRFNGDADRMVGYGRPSCEQINRIVRFVGEVHRLRALHEAGVPHLVKLASASCPDSCDYRAIAEFIRTAPIWYAMPLQKWTLATFRKREGGRLLWTVALKLLTPIAEAIEAVHAQGTLYHDLKPENILFNDDLKAQLADVGAMIDSSTQRDENNQPLLTPAYAATEVASGGFSTSQNDVFSWGVVAYLCISGKNPFEGPCAAAKRSKRLFSPLNSLVPSCPTPICQLVEQCLSGEIKTFRQLRESLWRIGPACEFAQRIIAPVAYLDAPDSDQQHYDNEELVKRPAVREGLSKWQDDHAQNPIAWVQGKLGHGKTGALVDYVRDNPEVAATLFCNARTTLGVALESLVPQLQRSWITNASAIEVTTLTLNAGITSWNDVNNPRVFRELVDALFPSDAPKGKRLVVLDALDEALECVDGQWRHRLAPLLDWLLDTKNLRLVVSSRPDVTGAIKALFGKHSHEPIACPPITRSELEEFVAERFPECWTNREHIDALQARSEGSFLFLKLFSEHCWKQTSTGCPVKISDIPNGLHEMFFQHFTQYFGNVGESLTEYKTCVRPLLELMAAASCRDLRTHDMDACLENACTPGRGLVNRARATELLRNYVTLTGDRPVITHMEVMNWLLDRQDDGSPKYNHVFRIDPKRGDEQLADWAWNRTLAGQNLDVDTVGFQKFSDGRKANAYWYHNGLHHLIAAGRFGDAVAFLNSKKSQRTGTESIAATASALAEDLAEVVHAIKAEVGAENVDFRKLRELFIGTYSTDDFGTVASWIGRNCDNEAWIQTVEKCLSANDYVVRYGSAEGQAARHCAMCERGELTRAVAECSELLAHSDVNRRELGCYTVAILAKNYRVVAVPDAFRCEWLDKMAGINEVYFAHSALGDVLCDWSLYRVGSRQQYERERLLASYPALLQSIWEHVQLDIAAVQALTTGTDDSLVTRERATFHHAISQISNLRERFKDFPAIQRLVENHFVPDTSGDVSPMDLHISIAKAFGYSDVGDLTVLFEFLLSHPLWSKAERVGSYIHRLLATHIETVKTFEVLDHLLEKSKPWRVRYGALETTFLIRSIDEGRRDRESSRFDANIASSFHDPISRIRGLCCENFVADLFEYDASQWLWRLNRNLGEHGSLPATKAVARWLRDDDCWVLEHVYRLFHTICHNLKDPPRDLITWTDNLLSELRDDQSPALLSRIQNWQSMERHQFLIEITRAKQEMVVAEAVDGLS